MRPAAFLFATRRVMGITSQKNPETREGRMPDTNQSSQTTVPALVLEGGGFRGMFTAGVLDVLMERGLTDFQSVWGTSAGRSVAPCVSCLPSATTSAS